MIKTNLQKGQILDSGFGIIDVIDLEELKACGIWAKHEKSGAEVFHVLNDDSENLFSFAFATSPQDNTGAAHILEHSVLCGSERYPLKDAFIVLAQGSLQTFLNAFTFPDKTVYPASSTNEHDYFNLMSVYGEAVFRPLIPEWTFMQEGHRLEFLPDKDELSITGVVYNEMKGAYSSLDTYAGLWSVKAVMPDTPYSFESGGNPENIPELTWEGLKEFHRTRYSPANCRIFLAGNIPTEKQLDFLNKEFLSSLDGGKVCAPIEKTGRWNETKKIHVPCPAGSELKSTIFLSWLCCDITDTNETIALAALAEILLGHDGSPLTRALIESGLGEDISPVSGLEGEIRETLFVAGLKGVGDIRYDDNIEKLILSVLNTLVNEGIPPQEIEAALLAMEFSQREIRRSGGPFSLVWMRRSLRAWLHGCKPWESLLIDPAIKKIKENLTADNRYFESLIQKYLLDNPHRALVIIEPKEDFLTQQEKQLSGVLADINKNLNETERQQIREKTKALEKIQSEANSPEALASIPHLSRADLSSQIEKIHRHHVDLRGVPALCHELYTNGITYMDIAFPVDVLPPEDYPWLQFFSRAVVSTGLPGMDYGEVSSLLARTVGGFAAMLQTGSAAKGTPEYLQTASGKFDLAGRDWITYRLKCLDEKIPQSLDLTLRMISEADFTDKRRINDLILEMKNEINSSLAPMGHIYASGRACRSNSHSKWKDELLSGISQIEFVNRLAKMEIGEVTGKLQLLREKINSAGMIINITGGSLGIAETELNQRFNRFGPPVPRNFLNGEEQTYKQSPAKAEVFASQSLQVGFAALALNSAPFDTIHQVAETVLTHQLSTGALWENIRMKGGAYGAFISSNCLENCISFATYRDPNPLRSLDVISTILKSNPQESLKYYGGGSESYLVKGIIGCYAKETRPRTSAENGLIDFFRFLFGIEDDYRKRSLERLIGISTADITDTFASLGSRTASEPVIITSVKDAEQTAKALGVEAKMLPV
ncbi:MAG: insulinase family protein [Treponema sp.]|jgi:Zn-dependent M16 (insulinase) family peptidase|nr:insulinase family protein [Treponema sp.]